MTRLWTLGFVLMFSAGMASASGYRKLEQLDSAALVLRMSVDGHPDVACGIKPEEAGNLLRALQPMIDSQLQELRGHAYVKPYWPTVQEVEACEKTCHCGVWGDLAEGAKFPASIPKSGQKRWKKALASAKLKASKQTEKQSLACAKSASPKFCTDELLKTLRKEAEADKPAAGL